MRTVPTKPWNRRVGALWLAAVLSASAPLATACVGGGGDSGGQGAAGDKNSATLTFWTINLKKQFSDYITGMINSYEKAHSGVHINWVDVPGQDISTKLLAAVANGKVPDVVNVDSSNLGPFTDKMTDLTKYFQGNSLADYQQGLVDPLRSGNKLTAIPWYNGGAPVGIYNTNIMSKVGFNPATPPKNYDDVLSLAKKVYDKTKTYGTNEIPSYVNGESAVLQYSGVKLLTPDKKKAAFNTPQTAQILEKFKKAYDSHAIAPGATTANTRSYPQSLDNRQIGFQADAFPFVLTSLQKNSPSVYKSLAITKAPANAQGKYLLLGQQTLAVPQASQHQAAAADFIKFVTNGANQLAFCKLVPIYPSTKSTTKDAYFTSNKDTTPLGKARKVILEELPNVIDGELGTGKDAELSDALSTQIRSYMQGSTNASQALSAAADSWDKTLAAKK